MSNDINLFQHTAVTVSQGLTKNIRRIRIVALSFLFVVPTATIVIFLFIFFSPQASLQQQEKELLTTASSLGNKVSDVRFINDRTANSLQFITKRSIYGKALQEVTLLLPTNVLIDTVTIQNNSIFFSVVSPSLSALQTYQTSLLAASGSTQVLHKIAFQTIQLTPETTNYQMTFQATIHE